MTKTSTVWFESSIPPNPDLSPWNSYLDYIESCKASGKEPTLHSYLVSTGKVTEWVKPAPAPAAKPAVKAKPAAKAKPAPEANPAPEPTKAAKEAE